MTKKKILSLPNPGGGSPPEVIQGMAFDLHQQWRALQLVSASSLAPLPALSILPRGSVDQ